jgi:hypothetical protein
MLQGIQGHVKCTHCEGAYPVDGEGVWTERACPWCRGEISVFAFPSLSRPPAARPAKAAVPGENLAACFFHAQKSASVPCDACGRFLCDLCDLRFQERHYCATCLDAAQRGEPGPASEAAELLKERVYLPQNLAFMLAFYSPLTLIGLYLTPLTAPASIWIAIRNWKRNDGFQIRGKWRAWAAILLALGQIASWVALIVLIFYAYHATLETKHAGH